MHWQLVLLVMNVSVLVCRSALQCWASVVVAVVVAAVVVVVVLVYRIVYVSNIHQRLH